MFVYIDNPWVFFECVKAFYLIRDNVTWASRLILDKFVELSYFGDGDKWYFFFHEILNNMAEQVFYNHTKIDYTITHESQAKFEQVLSAPLLYLKNMLNRII